MDYLIGIDIGGTKSAVSLADEKLEIVDRKSIITGTRTDPNKVLDRFIQMIWSLLEDHRIAISKVAGIGVSCGGPLDPVEGVILSPPNLPLWVRVPVRQRLQEAFNLSVTVENDANATALAEWKLGAGRGTHHFIYLTWGTGIGGGLIMDGKLYRGATGMAGEAGHQTLLPDGPLCGCGKRGCLEALAAGPAVARMCKERATSGQIQHWLELTPDEAEPNAKVVIRAAQARDEVAASILKEAGRYMGIGLANLIQIINPERIALGTLAIHAGELLLAPVREAINEYAWPQLSAACEVVPAELGDRAQDMAALVLVSLGDG